MQIVLENLPYIWLIWTGIGFFIVLIGIVMIAHNRSENTGQNESMDDSFLSALEKKTHVSQAPAPQKNMQETFNSQHTQIKELYIKGDQAHEIAKKLGVGVGEVELMLALNKME